MLSESHTPDLEDLAAFVDGRLSGERKARVEERLLRDEDYYEVFLATVHFQEQSREQSQEEQQGRETERSSTAPVAIARWRSWRVAAPLAAAAVLAIAVGVLRPAGDLAAVLDAPALVARGETWTDTGWSVTRSGGPGASGLSSQEIAFRLGARTVDLRVALAGDDPQAAIHFAAQAEGWCGDAGLFHLAPHYRHLREQIESGGETEALLDLARQAEEQLAESFEGPAARRFALGRWAEAGRLAALSGDAGALDRVLRRDPGSRSVAAIESQVERLKGADLELAVAEEAFRGILHALAGRG